MGGGGPPTASGGLPPPPIHGGFAGVGGGGPAGFPGIAPIHFGRTGGPLAVASVPALAIATVPESFALATLPLAFAEEDLSATGDRVLVRDLLGVHRLALGPAAAPTPPASRQCVL